MISKKTVSYLKTIWQTKKNIIILAVILILGAGLRLINIKQEPYWSDEILSLEIARHYIGNPGGLWNYLQIAEVHPPLYYYLIEIWGGWFGFGQEAIRILSLFFSLGLIYLAYLLVVVLFKNKKMALLAAFFTAILPIQIEFGQEARPYAIFSFLGVLSIILLAKYFEARRTKHKIFLLSAFIVSNILGLYLHYSYLLVLVPLFLYWLGKIIIEKKTNEIIWWLSTATMIFLGFYPWLPTLIFKSFLMDKVIGGSRRVFYGKRPFVFFEQALTSLIWTDKETPSIIEIITALTVRLIWVGLAFKIALEQREWLRKHKKELAYLLFILIGSIVLFLTLPSSTKYTILLFRHLLFDGIILAIFLAIMFSLIKNQTWRKIWMALFLVSLITFQINILSDDSKYDFNFRFKIVVDYINQYYQPHDLLLVYSSILRPQLNYFLDKNISGFKGVFPVQIMDSDFEATRLTMGMLENEAQLRTFDIDWLHLTRKMDYLLNKYHAKRVWVVGDDTSFLIRKWFVFNGWRVGFEPIIINGKKLFPLTLYVAPKKRVK